MASNILQNEETVERFLSDSAADFERFKSDRKSIGFEDKMKIADGMWRCYQNRSLASEQQEDTSGAPENRANVGSIRFFRLVNQKASLGYAVGSSVDVPFKFTTRANPEIWGSAEEAQSQASIHNALARYAWKEGKCDKKMYEFWFQEHKYCNLPVQVVWNEEKRRIAIKDPKTKKVTWKDKTVKVYPTFKTLHWSMVYADIYAPTIRDQNCVIVLSVVPWVDIQKGVKAGYYDKEAVELLREKKKSAKWDGSEGADARAAQLENSGESGYSPGESELFLVWDIYRWAPIKGAEYSDEVDYALHWCTSVGNSIKQSTPIRFKTDFDPDGEIPIEIIKAIPDDADMLYSMSWAEAARTPYSIECTLWEQTIDNISGINNPLLLIDSTLFKNKPDNLQYNGNNGPVDVDDVGKALAEFTPRDTTSQTAQLIGLVQNEEGVSASVNSNMMGEANGGRTPASESLAINRFSQQPNLGETSYILHQLLDFVAPKYKSYYQAFGDPVQIRMIADEQLDQPVYTDDKDYKIYGDFDVEVNVVDEFQEDFVQANQEIQLLQTVAASPDLIKSRSHSVDVGEWLSSIMRRLKTKSVDKIIKPAADTDAHLRQRDENRAMIETGEYIAPQETEDHAAHISEINAEILRWKPVTDAKLGDEASAELLGEQTRANDVVSMLLIPHKEAHEQMMNAASEKQNVLGAAPSGEQTPGQMSGNVPAAILGGAAGGQSPQQGG
jgi:hypothetical protein